MLEEKWFEYSVRAQPHHTDYAGIVWHGSYIAWMEEARVECLRSIGIEFAGKKVVDRNIAGSHAFGDAVQERSQPRTGCG